MDTSSLAAEIAEAFVRDSGKFYSPVPADSPLGAGQLLRSVRYPVFDRRDQVFDTYSGVVYVLSHECDVDPNNDRPFNDNVLVCPVLPLESVFESLSNARDADQAKVFLLNVARDVVSRVAYLPPIANDLDLGGFLNLNQISHTPVADIDLATQGIATLTGYGLNVIDSKLANHLLRPKSVEIPLQKW